MADNMKKPAPPPSGVGSDIREKVARLSDPLVWRAYEIEMENIERVYKPEFRDFYREKARLKLEPSLAKADAILSLLSSPSVGLGASRDHAPTADAASGCDATTLVPEQVKP